MSGYLCLRYHQQWYEKSQTIQRQLGLRPVLETISTRVQFRFTVKPDGQR